MQTKLGHYPDPRWTFMYHAQQEIDRQREDAFKYIIGAKS